MLKILNCCWLFGVVIRVMGVVFMVVGDFVEYYV